MMIFKDIPNVRQNQFITWSRIFSILCMNQFSEILEILDLPIVVDDPIQKISRNFFANYCLTRGVKIPTELDFISITNALNISIKQEREKLFEETFLSLEKTGVAIIIYNWGQNCHEFQDRKTTNFLLAITVLLRIWLIDVWQKKGTIASNVEQTEQDDMLNKWALWYKQSKYFPLNKLELDTLSLQKLYQVVLGYETKQALLKQKVQQIRDNLEAKSIWDRFAFTQGMIGGIFIELEGQYRIQLKQWKMILSILNTDKIRIIEKWAEQHRHILSFPDDLIIPFPSF